MNGIFEITVKGTKHKLMFRMRAVEIIKNLSINSFVNTGQVDELKSFVYLVYAGMCNYADSLDLVYPKYEDVYQIVDDLLSEHDSEEQQVNLMKCYNESKAGEKIKEFIKAVSEIKGEEQEVKEPIKKKKMQKANG